MMGDNMAIMKTEERELEHESRKREGEKTNKEILRERRKENG